MASLYGIDALRRLLTRFFLCMCVLASIASTQPVAAQTDDLSRIGYALNPAGNVENEALLRRWLAAIVSDPSLVELTTWVLNNYGSELSAYERAALELVPYVAAHADQFLFSSVAGLQNNGSWTAFANTVMANEAVRAALAEGQRTLDDPAAFSQRLNETRANLNSSTSAAPPLPAQACGAQPSTLVENSYTVVNSSEWAHSAGLVDRQLSDPAFYDFARAIGPGFTAGLAPQTELPLRDANGNLIPVWNLKKLVKGIITVAAAVVVCTAAVVGTVASAGAATPVAALAGAVAAEVVTGLWAVKEGVDQIIDASMQSNQCGDAPLCTAAQPCGAGVCSIGCCVTPQVAAQQAALARAHLMACASDADCGVNTHCDEGCCMDDVPN